MACFLFWKVDQVMERSSGKAGLRTGPASASVVGEMVGTVSGAGDAPHPAPSPSYFPPPIFLASAFCSLLFPEMLRLSELNGRDRYENHYPSQNKVRAVRDTSSSVEGLADSSCNGSRWWWHLN